MNSYAFSLLKYGLFAVLCQLSILFIWIESMSSSLSGDILYHRYASYLEYPLASILLLLGGSLFITYVIDQN